MTTIENVELDTKLGKVKANKDSVIKNVKCGGIDVINN